MQEIAGLKSHAYVEGKNQLLIKSEENRIDPQI